MGMGCQRNVYGGFTTEKTRYPFYRRLGGTRGRSGLVRKNSYTPGFDSRTVQPVASRYTNCAFPALLFNGLLEIKRPKCETKTQQQSSTNRKDIVLKQQIVCVFKLCTGQLYFHMLLITEIPGIAIR